MNFRDMRGRTALHVAAAFNNRSVCESLLFLGANPLIEDEFGQRPIDMASDDSIRDLLSVKMAKAIAPSQYYKIEKTKARNLSMAAKQVLKSGQQSTMSLGSNLSSVSKKGDPSTTFDVKELKSMVTEKIVNIKFG